MATESGTLTVLFPLLLLLFGLAFTVVIDPYIQRTQRSIMLIIVVLCLSLIGQNYFEDEVSAARSILAWDNLLSAYGYSVRPVILVLFLCIIQPKGKKWLQWALVGINAALYCSSPFTKLCFYMREADYASLRGPLWLSCFVISAILLADLLLQTILRYRVTKKLEHLIPLSLVVFIVASVVLDYRIEMERQPVSYLTIAITVCSVYYYIWLHLQFVREHESDLMATQRIQIMMTQIQPHFLFNALNTIRALYAKDSPLADRALENFSTYLRQNLESLSQTDLIPIARELEHTRLYAEIEMLRFPDTRVEYRIEDEDFRVPALTIQPLVENAIRHGVRGRKGGVVVVSTAREGDGHRITIRDNGAGFDPTASAALEGPHIGLKNVKERVEQMCGGVMILNSGIGEGSTVTILIPDASRTGRKEKRI